MNAILDVDESVQTDYRGYEDQHIISAVAFAVGDGGDDDENGHC